jgi:uncharacterized CHY-type Zn-finger protein
MSVDKETSAQIRRKLGLCAVCGKQSSTYRCNECNEHRNSLRKQNRKYWVRNERCTICGKELTSDKYKTCNSCRDKYKQYYKTLKKLNKTKKQQPNKKIETKTKLGKDDILAIVKVSLTKMSTDKKSINEIISILQIQLELLGVS